MEKPFAVFRRELQLFEILRAVVGKDGGIQRLAYAELPASAVGAVWSVRKGPQAAQASAAVETLASAGSVLASAGSAVQLHIKGKPVELLSTGAVLTTENYPEPIPIVYCSKSRYFPTSIRGIRVSYMDGLDPAYFTKKSYGSKALSITFRGDRTEVVEEGLVEAEAEGEAEPTPTPYVARPREPYEPEECDMVKVGSCLAVLFIFILTAYLSNKSIAHSHNHLLHPFSDTCSAEDASFYMDPYTAYYP
jgi:hypothetical protein